MTNKIEKLQIIELDPSNKFQMEKLEKFCNKCADLGIENNSSIQNLKIDKFANRHFKFWIVCEVETNEIIGIAGAHHLPEINQNCFRLLFRGCILPQYRGYGINGLSKNHLNSYLFKNVTPLQIDWAKNLGCTLFIISTNLDTNNGLSPTNKLFEKLARQGLVSKYFENYNLFSTKQNIWELKVDYFLKVIN